MSAKLLKKISAAPSKRVALLGFPPRSCGAIAAIFLLSSRQLGARSAEIGWHAPKDCGSSEDFENDVARIVGKPLAELDSSSWGRADVSIRYEEAAWQVMVVLESNNNGTRERKVTAGSCHEALEAAELIVATSLYGAEMDPAPASDPSDQGLQSKPPDATSTLPSAAPSSAAAVALPLASKPEASLVGLARNPAPGPRSDWNTLVGARVGAYSFLFPTVAEAAWLTLELRNQGFGVELLLGAARSSSTIDGGGSVAVTLLSGGLVGCRSSGSGTLRVAACGGAELGLFRASGRGLPNVIPRTTNALWSAGLIQCEASWQVTPRFAFVAAVQGAASFNRMALSVRGNPNYPTLPETRRFDLRPGVGLQGRF